MEALTDGKFRFDDFELDCARRSLTRGGVPVPLNSRAFDLLQHLIENNGNILSKDELLGSVWPGQFVEENNLSVHISALRKALGEPGNGKRFIVTVSGRGYSFVEKAERVSSGFEFTSLSGPASNVEPIFGRQKEIAELKHLLGSSASRSVVLTGAGGSGKTRLAKAVADELSADIPDGVYFVELAAISDPELVPSTIVKTLELKESNVNAPLDSVKQYLFDRRILLILDNFEQIVAASGVVTDLIAATKHLKILVTSRIALSLTGEREFLVNPLNSPPPGSALIPDELSKYSAMELFLKRAQSARPGFLLTEQNAAAISEICRRLDGLPLAIELAAARIRLLSPESILERLKDSLNLLEGGAKDLPERQRTMRGAVQWSYELLDEDERALFRRLSVFAGGFTVEAAEAVAGGGVKRGSGDTEDDPANTSTLGSEGNIVNKSGDSQNIVPSTLDLLTSLTEQSLLNLKEQRDGGVRLQMLEVVREFALDCMEQIGEVEAIKQNHALYFLSVAEKAEMISSGEIGSESLDKLENEHDNLRAALSWTLQNDGQIAARIAAALRFFWLSHGHLGEGLSWSKSALQATENTFSEARSKLLLSNGLFFRNKGDLEAARKVYEQTLAESRKLNDFSQMIKAFHGLGAIAVLQKDFAAAQTFNEESLALSRKISDEMQIAYSLCSFGDLEMSRQNLTAARLLLEECLQISKNIGNERLLTVTFFNLGTIDYFENEYDAARLNFAESLRIGQKMGNKMMISCVLDGFGAIDAANGNVEQSAKLAGAADALRESIGYIVEPAEEIFNDKYLKKVRHTLGEKAFAEIYTQGKAINSEKAVGLIESSILDSQAQEK